MDLFELLKLIHVLGAIAWVGGAILSQAQAFWVNRRNSPPDFVAFIDFQAWLSTRYFAPLSGVVVAAGIGMVIQSGYNFSDLWIVIGLVLFTISAVVGSS